MKYLLILAAVATMVSCTCKVDQEDVNNNTTEVVTDTVAQDSTTVVVD